MRIAWFTPMSQKSAIGRFSVAVAASLAKLADVEICYFDADRIRETVVPARRFQSSESITVETLSSYDVVVYNFGNYLPFHREIFLLSRQWPGVCILHDFVMHHFFAAYHLDYLSDPDSYKLLLETTYGPAAPLAGRVWETDEVVRFPLFEEVTRGALGVVTHSEFFKQHVEACFAGPVARIPLAYDTGTNRPESSRQQLGVKDDEILIVTIGHVNPNKRIEKVIDAIARLGAASPPIVYTILGPALPDYERKLKAAAKARGLTDSIRFLGQVPDEVLSGYLSAADICVNLRFPAMEGASASVIEEMLFGKPVIVMNTGFFAELPDDCVVKVRADRDADLTSALKELVDDESARKRIGALAQVFAENEFHADKYASKFMDFLWDVRSARPLLALADRVGVELARIGVARDANVVDSLAQELLRTFVRAAPASDSHQAAG
jgi:glycosyltransferase involved in cell wall biosynthesis